jgi:hypothetical protein
MSLTGFAPAAGSCFVAVWLLCEAAAWLAPAGGSGFRGYMARHVTLILARAGCVLVVVAAAIRPLGADPAGALAGVVLGWLAAAGRSAWREQRELKATSGGRPG